MLPNLKSTPYKHLLSIKDLNQAHKHKNQTKMAETKPKFDRGKKFQIKPMKVEAKASRPTFQKNNSTHYNYMVQAEVKGNPDAIWFEYASPTQDALDKFVLNVFQWVECTQPSDIACNIQPCEPPGEEKSKEQMAYELANRMPNTKAPSGERGQYIPPFPNAHNQDAPKPVDLRGHPYAFIYAWAKDIVVAEMNNKSAISMETPADIISRISYYAEILYGDMMKKINT